MRVDDFLQKFGLKYEELTSAEKETLNTMYSAVQNTQLTTEKVKDYISLMKNGVEEELAKSNLDQNQDIYLKARLRNYLMLEAFLTSPDRAKTALEAALAGYKAK